MKVTFIRIITAVLCTVTEGLIKVLEDFEIKDKWRPPKLQQIEIDQNTEKSSGDLRTLAVKLQ